MKLEIIVNYGNNNERSFCIDSGDGIPLLLNTLEEMSSSGFVFIDRIEENEKEKGECARIDNS